MKVEKKRPFCISSQQHGSEEVEMLVQKQGCNIFCNAYLFTFHCGEACAMALNGCELTITSISVDF